MQSQGELMQILGDIDAARKAFKKEAIEVQEEIESSLWSMRNRAIVDAITTHYETQETLRSLGQDIKEHILEAGEDLWEKLDRYL